jgi:hypothetical protein
MTRTTLVPRIGSNVAPATAVRPIRVGNLLCWDQNNLGQVGAN